MEEKQITLQIDGHFITVPEGSTILEAAIKIGINIPTLCHIDLKGTCIKNNPASCRICVVEVMGRRNLAPACATRCTEGMVVKTSTLRVMNARKVVAELILSDHPNDCLTCPKCGNCELQTLALRFNIREMPFNGGELSPRKREITASIVRNMDKCIFCRRCESVCNDVQTVGALGAIRRGFNTTIAPAFDRMMTESECTYCGQCVAVCPVGALTERDYTNRLLDDLANPDKVVIVQTAPAVRAALGEEFGFPPGTLVTGKTSDLLGAASACLLNSLKVLEDIDHEVHLVSPQAIEPIQTLKTSYLGSINPRLHTDEILIALSISAATDKRAALALSALRQLKGCEVHSSVMLSSVDEAVFKKLGMHLTCDPKTESDNQQ